MQDASSAPVSFGKYLLDAELARGGMSRVWQARLRGPGGFEKQLVVKQILPQLAQDPSFVELLVHEANTLVRMSHPNIVPVYELGIVDGVYFLAMERVHGATVAELLRDGPLPAALVAELGAQIAEALRYAHERFELVHRDVTPRNVMVDADGHVRLLDFGIAAPSARTGKGELFGSPGYMSPEQAARKALTPASDLFGLGALLYEALTGRRAVRDGVAARLAGDIAIDAELSALIDELLDTDPSARGSAARTTSRLRGWLAQKQPEGARAQLGERVDAVLARAAASTSAGTSGAGAAQRDAAERGGDAGEDATFATPRITRSIATSATLTQMLVAGTTEALPRARRAGRWLMFAGGLAALSGAFVATWLALGPRAQTEPSPPNARSAPPAAAPKAKPPAPAPAAAPTTPASTPHTGAATPASSRPATLSIHATPWAEARLDGKSLGPTPHRALRVRAGPHVLTLDCPPLGKKARVPLRLAAGAEVQVLVDMQSDPPEVSVR